MKDIDIRFNQNAKKLLQSLIGKKLEKFFCQRIEYTAAIDEVIIFQIEKKLYKFTNNFQIMDYMNDIEEVAVFEFKESDAGDLKAYEDAYTPRFPMVPTIIEQIIKEIKIVNENQQLFQNGIQICNATTVRGIVFVLEDGREIALQKDLWFSELIYVSTGHNLIEEFRSLEETFLRGWEAYPEFCANGSRKIVVLRQDEL